MLDYEKELRKELQMRQKVWLKHNQYKFASNEHQKRYDILAELAEIMKYAPLAVFEKMRQQALSASDVVQSSMDFAE